MTFKPGESGNPGGRPKNLNAIQQLAAVDLASRDDGSKLGVGEVFTRSQALPCLQWCKPGTSVTKQTGDMGNRSKHWQGGPCQWDGWRPVLWTSGCAL
jgi:hypothetical protein